MCMCTEIQNCQQTEGPGRPKARILATFLDALPPHMEVRAVSINGQTGIVTIETYHEGLEQAHEFIVP